VLARAACGCTAPRWCALRRAVKADARRAPCSHAHRADVLLPDELHVLQHHVGYQADVPRQLRIGGKSASGLGDHACKALAKEHGVGGLLGRNAPGHKVAAVETACKLYPWALLTPPPCGCPARAHLKYDRLRKRVVP
jgi:hypothetical protein